MRLSVRAAIVFVVCAWALTTPFIVWRLLALNGAIQSQRAKATADACQKQNVRHDHTHERLENLFAEAREKIGVPTIGNATPQQAKAIESISQSEGPTYTIIDAIDPHEDCAALVRQREAR